MLIFFELFNQNKDKWTFSLHSNESNNLCQLFCHCLRTAKIWIWINIDAPFESHSIIHKKSKKDRRKYCTERHLLYQSNGTAQLEWYDGILQRNPELVIYWVYFQRFLFIFLIEQHSMYNSIHLKLNTHSTYSHTHTTISLNLSIQNKSF